MHTQKLLYKTKATSNKKKLQQQTDEHKKSETESVKAGITIVGVKPS